MKLRTFYKKLPLIIKKLNLAYLQKTQTSNMSFIKNSIFGINRDPCGPPTTVTAVVDLKNRGGTLPIPVLKIAAHGAHVRGTKAIWGDQRAHGPEN